MIFIDYYRRLGGRVLLSCYYARELTRTPYARPRFIAISNVQAFPVLPDGLHKCAEGDASIVSGVVIGFIFDRGGGVAGDVWVTKR
jgi:hypothetical protein